MKISQLALLGLSGLVLLGCKEQNATKQTEQSAQAAVTEQLPLISAKSEVFLQEKKCFKDEHCYQLDINRLVTNVDWLNHYFENDLREGLIGSDLTIEEDNQQKKSAEQQLSLEQVKKSYRDDIASIFQQEDPIIGYWFEYKPRFIAQNQQLAMFTIYTDIFSGGAHNIYVTKYMNFDLKAKKALTLDDILLPDKKARFTELLDQAYANYLVSLNQSSYDQADRLLKERKEEGWNVSLTDNFTFTAQGMLFSYPPYSAGPFVEGQIQVTIPYEELIDVIKPDYLFNTTKTIISE